MAFVFLSYCKSMDDNQTDVLDVLREMMEAEREFCRTLRFLQSNREQLLAVQQRNMATMLALVRTYMVANSSTATFTIPLTVPRAGASLWDEPVVVRPTAAQISAGSAVVTVEDAEPTNCSICQDSLSNTHTRLTHCGHRFHTTCISEWFTQSVRCPMCRHDIRDVAPTSSAPESEQPRLSSRLASWLVGANPTNHTVETAESDEHHA
jgi:hypothetical protein